MKRDCEYRLSHAQPGYLLASVPQETSLFSRALLLMGITLFGLAGGSWISESVWADSNNGQSRSLVDEDFSAQVLAKSEGEKSTPTEDDLGLVVQAPGIRVTVQEPPFPVSANLQPNMSTEDVLITYGQPHLTFTSREHGQTIQLFEYIDPDLRSTSILFQQGMRGL